MTLTGTFPGSRLDVVAPCARELEQKQRLLATKHLIRAHTEIRQLHPKGNPVPINPETIDHVTLERLVEAGAVRATNVVGHASGWGVVVEYGTVERTLAARRGAVRTFRRFETLVSYLKDIGIFEFHVNATSFDAQAIKAISVRPDSSERMRSAFEAKAHIDWMQQKVAQSLADPAPNVSHAQVMAEAQVLIDARRKRNARKAAP